MVEEGGILSLFVTFDSLQLSVRFIIQDGERNRRTKDAFVPPKRPHCMLCQGIGKAINGTMNPILISVSI